jgi:hypothetical protein
MNDRMAVKLLDRREVYAGSSRDIEQIIDNGFQQRNSFFAANRFRFSFRIAWDQRAIGSWRRFGVSEDVNPVVDLFFEFVFVDEAVDLHGAKKMADAFVDAAGGPQSFIARDYERGDCRLRLCILL